MRWRTGAALFALASLASLALTPSCSSGGDGAAQNPADAGPDTPALACPTLTSAEAKGDPVPGSAITLSLVGDAAGGTIAWTATAGTVGQPAQPSTAWNLPKDVAVDVPAKLTATVTITKEGCDAKTASVDVTADYPAPLRTVVVYSTAVADSKDVASAYAKMRAIPDDHLCGVTATGPVSIPTAEFKTFSAAVLACAAQVGAHVQYIVPVYGVPYKVSGQVHDLGTPANLAEVSLDALLVYGAAGTTITNPMVNPLCQGKDKTGGTDSKDGAYAPYVRFGDLRAKYKKPYFMVARIDGADATAAKALVDRTAAAEALAKDGKLDGVVYVDGNRGTPHPATDDFGSYESGEWNIIGVENVFTKLGKYRVVADYNSAEFGTAPAPLTCPDALYYAGWYSFGHYNDAFTWKPGAIGAHLDSCSACDIRGNRDWSAVALRRGITATFGAVNEPYVAGLPEYDQFFLYITQGASFGEAAYESTVYGAWMAVFVGDPLYRPYPAK